MRPRPPRGPSVYKLNQGRAIDILRRDYPKILTQRPDFSIFCIKAYNRTMARFLLADAMERPKEKTRALRAWLKAIIDAPA